MENHKDNPIAQRLLREWKEHKKIIVAVDFDDTICPWNLFNEKKCLEVINLVKQVVEVGAYVVIHTACDEKRYPEIKEWCKKHNLRLDTIGDNPVPLKYGNSRKPYYNILLDDRAGLKEAMSILEYCMWVMKLHIKGDTSVQNVEF